MKARIRLITDDSRLAEPGKHTTRVEEKEMSRNAKFDSFQKSNGERAVTRSPFGTMVRESLPAFDKLFAAGGIKRRRLSSKIIHRAAFLMAALLMTTVSLQAQDNQPQRLPDARVGEKYELRINAEGSSQPLYWSAVPVTALPSGITSPLPPGLALDPNTAVLSGTPTTAQDTPYFFAVEVRTLAKAPPIFRQTYSMLVNSPIRRLTISGGSLSQENVAQKAAQEKQKDCKEEEPLDVESNSDEVSIAVRDTYSYNPDDVSVIDLKDPKKKDKPILKPAQLIADTIGRCQDLKVDDYVIVHLVKWPDQDPPARQGNEVKYEVEKEKWFLYRNVGGDEPWELQTAQEGTRIYGKRRVAVLLLHLTARDSWDIKYTVSIEKKVPAPIQNVLDLAGIIFGAKATGSEPDGRSSYWGGRMLLLKDIPADLTVQSNIAFLPSREMVTKSGGEEPAKQTQQPKSYSKVYDNEGRYHWDVSAGIPLKSFKDVTYDVEGTQVTAKEINRLNAYGFLNLFLNPKGVDTKGEEFYKTPHLVLGVPISGKPLDRPFVGLGIGFYKPKVKFNLFGGIVFNRVREPQTLANGQTATEAQLQADLQTKWVRKFIFGINLPIKQFKEALTPKK